MRVEIDEEKERKEMAFALSISIEMIYSPPPPNQSSQGIRTSTSVSILPFKITNFLNNPHERKQKVENKFVVQKIHPSSSRRE